MSSSVGSLATLLKQADIEDHEEILKAADTALKQSKGDVETQHVRAVALLKLDRYEDGVKAIEAGGEKLKERAETTPARPDLLSFLERNIDTESSGHAIPITIRLDLMALLLLHCLQGLLKDGDISKHDLCPVLQVAHLFELINILIHCLLKSICLSRQSLRVFE